MGNFADQYAKDFISKYTGGFMTSNTNPGSNSSASNTSTTSSSGNSYFTPGSYGGNPSETKNTPNTANTANIASPQPGKNTLVHPTPVSSLVKLTCAEAIEQANIAIDQFAKAAVIAKDQWSVYSFAQKVNGMSEYLNYGCDVSSLKILNLGKTGVNRTQDKACVKLIEFIKPILKPVPAGVSPLVYLDNIALSQQGYGLSKYLGAHCQANIVEGSQVDEIATSSGDGGVVIQTLDANGQKSNIYKIKAGSMRALAVDLEQKANIASFLQEKLVGLRTVMW